jgi:hypothetical protein
MFIIGHLESLYESTTRQLFLFHGLIYVLHCCIGTSSVIGRGFDGAWYWEEFSYPRFECTKQPLRFTFVIFEIFLKQDSQYASFLCPWVRSLFVFLYRERRLDHVI